VTRARALALGLVLWAAAAAPAAAQVTTTQPPNTEPPTTPPPPVTDPPVTDPPTTPAPAPTTTRPRTSTTRGTTTTSGPATTTTIRLLPPPSVAPQDPAAAPVGTTQSDHISSAFVWMSILGFLFFAAILVSQWFLTRPGRRGWTL
jgi:hypothetical protein